MVDNTVSCFFTVLMSQADKVRLQSCMHTGIHHWRAEKDASPQVYLTVLFCACTHLQKMSVPSAVQVSAESPDLIQHLRGFAAGKPGEKLGGLVCADLLALEGIMPQTSHTRRYQQHKEGSGTDAVFPTRQHHQPSFGPCTSCRWCGSHVEHSHSQPIPTSPCPPWAPHGSLGKPFSQRCFSFERAPEFPHWQCLSESPWATLLSDCSVTTGKRTISLSEWQQLVQLSSHEADTEMRGWYWNSRLWRVDIIMFIKISCCAEQIVSYVLLAGSGLDLCPHMFNSGKKTKHIKTHTSTPCTLRVKQKQQQKNLLQGCVLHKCPWN